MYNRLFTPSTLFGMVLLLLATAGVLLWASQLVDIETPVFDVKGWALLGSALGILIVGLLFVRRTRWVRRPTSVLLHILAPALLATLPFTTPGESPIVKTAIVSSTLLAVGLLCGGILVLRSQAMQNDLTRGPAGPFLKPTHALVAGGCLLSCAALGAWQLLPLLMGKPTIAMDYLARANRGRKPANYNPSRNAAPHYEQLFSQFTPLPGILKNKWKSWPADLNPEESKALEEWAPANESLLTCLTEAAQCPYWWYELKSSDGSVLGAGVPKAVLEQWRHCAWGVLVLSKYGASRGNTDDALRLLADLHMLGMHQIRGGMLVEQLTGLAICNITCDTLLAILAHCEVGPDSLRRTLDVLAPRIAQIRVPRFSGVEYAYGRDRIQRAFTSDGRGSGRLIPRCLYDYKKKHAGFYPYPLPYLDAVRVALTHPLRQETTLLFEEFFTVAGRLARQTPWELHTQNITYEERVTSLLSPNYFLNDAFNSTGRCIRMSWRARALGEGTALVLAVFVFRAQEGRLPESLSQLVDAGLLSRAPLDPYSGQPYLYRITGDHFTLYSVGEDFVDDHGLPCDGSDGAGGDHVFWPLDPVAQVAASKPQKSERLEGSD